MKTFVVNATRCPTNYNDPRSYLVEAATEEDAIVIVKHQLRDLSGMGNYCYNFLPYTPPTQGKSPGYEGGFMNSTELSLVKTARGKGAVGKSPLVLKHILKHASVQHRILDFGSGATARQTEELRKRGFSHTYAFDIGEVLSPHAITRELLYEVKWDWIMVSNVVNVQPDLANISGLISRLGALTTTDLVNPAKVVINYPKEPRKYPALTSKVLEDMLRNTFEIVEKIKGSTSLHVCTNHPQ